MRFGWKTGGKTPANKIPDSVPKGQGPREQGGSDQVRQCNSMPPA